MRVLLVDDNVELAQFLGTTLSESTVDVVVADSAYEALEKSKVERFDGYVVDSVMGETDGVGLILEMRAAHKGNHGVPAVLMSNISTALARRIAQDANCVFLPKPFSPTQFVEAVRELR